MEKEKKKKKKKGGGGGGVDRLLSTSNNNNLNENNGLQNKHLCCNNQSFQNDLLSTQKTNCQNENIINENEERINSLCLKCGQNKIKNKKVKTQELLTVDFARYNRANNGDKMDAQFNKENFEQRKNCNTQNSYNSNKVSLNNKGRISTTYKKRYSIVQSTVILLSWLFVVMMSAILIYFTNNNMINKLDAVNGTKISTVEQLKNVANNLSGSYYLANDINVESGTWTRIGTSSSTPFTGTFDGNGYVITFSSSVSLNTGQETAGFFGYIENATITNLGIYWENFIGVQASFSGGIAAYATDSEISNCYVDGVISGYPLSGAVNCYVGGIIGSSDNSIIKNCFNKANVTVDPAPRDLGGTKSSGSIIADGSATIENCYNSGVIYNDADDRDGYAIGASSINSFSVGTPTYQSYTVSNNWPYDVWGDRGTSAPYLRVFSEYSITYQPNGGSGTIANSYYKKNSTASVTQSQFTAPSGYKFNGWVDESGTPYQSGQTFTLTKNLVLTAQWILDIYTITFDITTNGGSGNAPTAQEVNVGEGITLPTGNYKSGWEFVGWSENASSTTSGLVSSPYTPTRNVTLYAIYSKTITVNFYQLGATTPTTQNQTIYNTTQNHTFTAPTVITSSINGEVTQTGWTTASGSDTITYSTNTITLADSVNLYAVVKYNVVITYKANGGVGNDVTSSSYAVTKSANGEETPKPYKANATLIANPFTKNDYTFVGWSTDANASSGTSAESIYAVDSNTILYAIWQSNYVNVTFEITTNVAVIFNVYDNSGNFVQQMFVDRNSNEQTVTTQLLKGKTYIIKLSTIYTANINVNGGQLNSREMTVEVGDNGSNITMAITGFGGSNSIII